MLTPVLAKMEALEEKQDVMPAKRVGRLVAQMQREQDCGIR
jgi:hypothetical protein